MAIDYLLLLVDSKGSDTENATSITEVYLGDFDKVKHGFTMEYPSVGCKYRGTSMSESFQSDLVCTSISFSREAKKFYSADPNYSGYNGKDCVTIEATYSINYSNQSEKFTKKIASSGYKTFKVNSNFGNWLYTLNSTQEGVTKKSLPVAQADIEQEVKIPISQMDLKTNVLGNVDEVAYDLLRGKINSSEFQGRPKGTVLYDGYSIQPKFNGDVVTETELTLTFKILPMDWNIDWRNRSQLLNKSDNFSKMYWQKDFPNRADYIFDYTDSATGCTYPYQAYLYDCIKSSSGSTPTYYTYAEIKERLNGLPMWSGSLTRKKNTNGTFTYVRQGDLDIGSCGWDVKYWLKNNALGDVESNRQYMYEYADFSTLLSGWPVINEYEEPTPPDNNDNDDENTIDDDNENSNTE